MQENIELFFSGHFICRLATNPDPFDEPRGRAGWTRAYPGEPDLDRHIQFVPHDGYVRDLLEPPLLRPVQVFKTVPALQNAVGMQVLLETVDGKPPSFEGRDGAIASPGAEPIVPLSVLLRMDGTDVLSVEYCKSLADINRMRVVAGTDFASNDIDVSLIQRARELHFEWNIGIATRISRLQTSLADVKLDPQIRTVLQSRLRACKATVTPYGMERRCQTINTIVPGAVKLMDNGTVSFGGTPDLSPAMPWPLMLRLFGFDPDALAGLCVGKLTVPLI